ncbi:MAG: DUF3276 family protein [Flavobacteriales bacterium]
MLMSDDREDVYSKPVRAGKRTYFFDVKSTRGRDLYLTITESKKHTHEDGSASYEKHKIFLYKEDFEKFIDGLREVYAEIDRLKATGQYMQHDAPKPERHDGQSPTPDVSSKSSSQDGESDAGNKFTDVNFEDLDRKDI